MIIDIKDTDQDNLILTLDIEGQINTVKFNGMIMIHYEKIETSADKVILSGYKLSYSDEGFEHREPIRLEYELKDVKKIEYEDVSIIL